MAVALSLQPCDADFPSKAIDPLDGWKLSLVDHEQGMASRAELG
jgi:hypothetical protein